MGATAILATGTTITFSGFAYKFISFDGPGFECETIDANKLATEDWVDKMPGSLIDPGQLSGTVEYDGTMPTLGVNQTMTVTFPNSNSISGKGFLKSFKPAGEVEGKLTADVTFELHGEWS